MDFEASSERLATLHEYCFESKTKKIEQNRFQIINDSMQMKSVRKTKFARLNDKCFYFHNRIVSLPFGHFLLNKVREENEKHRADLHIKIKEKLYEVLALESCAVHLCGRVRILRSIYAQSPLLYLLNSQVLLQIKSLKSTRELTINGSWKLVNLRRTVSRKYISCG